VVIDRSGHLSYTLSQAWSGVNWAAQGAFGTDFYDRSILRPKHRAYYRSGRPVIKIGQKGALGSHETRPIHSAPSVGQSISLCLTGRDKNLFSWGLVRHNSIWLFILYFIDIH